MCNMQAFKYEKGNDASERNALLEAKKYVAKVCEDSGVPTPLRFKE